MKTSKWLRELPFILLIAIPWMVLWYVGDGLPAQVPSHYSMSDHGWVVDHWMSPVGFVTFFTIVTGIIYLAMTVPAYLPDAKANWLYYFKLSLILFLDVLTIYTITGANMGTNTFSNLTMLVLSVIVNGFIYWIFRYGKMMSQQPLSPKYYNIIWAGTHFISSLPFILLLFARQNWMAHRTIPQAVLLFLAVTANLTYNVKPNRFIGIRTPWTLADEDVWRKTHHVCGKWFFATSLIGFVISIFAPEKWLSPLIVIIPLFCTGYAMIYSYWLYKKRASV